MKSAAPAELEAPASVVPQAGRLQPTALQELGHTIGSLVSTWYDWLVLRTPLSRFIARERTFAFLVHPRTDEFLHDDVYGHNDIYRPFPCFRWLFKILPEQTARKLILWFAKAVVPITLSRIRVEVGDTTCYGYLLSTVRTPSLLLGADRGETKSHLADLFALATNKGVRRVGLGALLPSMTGYGKRFTSSNNKNRPGVSTGHAYTAYSIAKYLKFLVSKRNLDVPSVRVAIVGAAGSTGKALVRVLKKAWTEQTRLDLTLVDVAQKEHVLRALAKELEGMNTFASVRVGVDLAVLSDVAYVVVVTNASGAIIRPEHLRPGTVVIDDSQPRNTSRELVDHGCYVLDVLARVSGLDCNFDFGFQTNDKSVTFTCLAETILATIVGEPGDLAVGEVTDDVVERMFEIVRVGERLGLVSDSLPLFSFGRELSPGEQYAVLQPV